MKSFKEILKEEISDIKTKDYDLSDAGKRENRPWVKDGQALHDMRKRSINAEKIFKEKWNNNYEVKTSDGYTIYFTKVGRKEFCDGFQTAFFSEDRKSAAYKKYQKNWPLANELLKTVDILGELVKKSTLEYKEPNLKPEQKPDIDHYEIFFVPVIINEKPRKMRIKVEYKNIQSEEGIIKGKRNYYYHWLQENKIPVIPIISEITFLE
jgi:hypothetical protein